MQFFGTVMLLATALLCEVSVAQVPPNPLHVKPYRFNGCYNDTYPLRALKGKFQELENTMTIETCSQFCKEDKWFGLEYSTQCFCGQKLQDNTQRVDVSNCDYACSGNGTEFCGGYDFLTMYRRHPHKKVTSRAEIDEYEVDEEEFDDAE